MQMLTGTNKITLDCIYHWTLQKVWSKGLIQNLIWIQRIFLCENTFPTTKSTSNCITKSSLSRLLNATKMLGSQMINQMRNTAHQNLSLLVFKRLLPWFLKYDWPSLFHDSSDRKNHRSWSVKKLLLKIYRISPENTCWGLLLIKDILIKNRFLLRYFPVKLAKFLKTNILKNISARLLLKKKE